MKQSLLNLYNGLKEVFVGQLKAAIDEKRKDSNTLPLNGVEVLLFDHTTPTETVQITEIKVIKEGDNPSQVFYTYLAHCFYTDVDTSYVDEEWEPLRDLTMDVLFEIADSLE